MINNSTHLTKSCKCDKPEHEIILKKIIRDGKSFGKIKELIYCKNCKAQWYKIRLPNG